MFDIKVEIKQVPISTFLLKRFYRNDLARFCNALMLGSDPELCTNLEELWYIFRSVEREDG